MKKTKNLRLYTSLFCLSLVISASVAVVHADSTQNVTVTYSTPSISYEVVIPSTFSLNDSNTLTFSLSEDSDLMDCYAVMVSLDQTCFARESQDEVDTKYPYIYLYQNGNTSSTYKRAYTLTNYEDKQLFTYSTAVNGYDIVARLYDPNSETYTSQSGMTFHYVPGHSRLASDTSTPYSSKLKFKISGS